MSTTSTSASTGAACRLPARLDCLVQAVAHLEAFCAEHGVPDVDRLRLTLFVEELFINTVSTRWPTPRSCRVNWTWAWPSGRSATWGCP